MSHIIVEEHIEAGTVARRLEHPFPTESDAVDFLVAAFREGTENGHNRQQAYFWTKGATAAADRRLRFGSPVSAAGLERVMAAVAGDPK